jgi:multiple sugar transport system substrate-binding protein
MKRTSLLLAAGWMVGCGSDAAPTQPGPSNPTPVTITVLRHDNPPYVKADDDAFAAYSTAHTNVTITSSTLRYPSLTASLLADLPTDKIDADLVRVPPSWVCAFADHLADVPADVVTLQAAQAAFFAAPLAGSTCGGKLKGLPLEYNLEYGGVVVNLDKYQAKFPGKTPNWQSWASFISDAAALTEYDTAGNPAANGLDIAPDWPQPVKHIFFSLILQKGGKYWSGGGDTFDVSAGAKFDFNNAAARESLSEMVDWIVKSKVMHTKLIPDKNTFVTTRLAVGATGFGWNDPDKPLSVMGYAGTWAVPNTIGQIPAGKNTKYDFFALPPMAGTQHKFVQNSGFALVVPKTSKHQKEAWDIARSIALDPAAAKKWSATGGALPALKVNGTAAAAADDPMLAKVQPLLEQGRWVGYIPAAAIESVEGALMSNYFDVVNGKKDLTKALADMQEAANAALALR